MQTLLIVTSLLASVSSANLRRRIRDPADLMVKPDLQPIQAPEGPNIFNPEALPVWMRPTAPGGDGGAGAIGAAASADSPGTTTESKETTLNSKFGESSQSFKQTADSNSNSNSNSQQLNHHHHHHHRHSTEQKFQSAGEGGEEGADAEAPAENAPAGIPVEGVPQGPAGGAPTSGPLPPALPSNPQVGMMFPAGMAFSGAPAAWPLGGAQGPPPGSSTVDMGQGGTTPFHISTSPMAGNTLSDGGKASFGTVVSPVMPGAPTPEFK